MLAIVTAWHERLVAHVLTLDLLVSLAENCMASVIRVVARRQHLVHRPEALHVVAVVLAILALFALEDARVAARSPPVAVLLAFFELDPVFHAITVFLVPVVTLEFAHVAAPELVIAATHATAEWNVGKVARMRDGCRNSVVLTLQHKSAL